MKNPKKGYKLEKTIYQQIEEIPEKWDFVKLEDVGEIVGGGTPDTTKEGFWKNGKIPWFTPQELTNLKTNFVSNSERKITEKGRDESSAKEMPKGTLLLTTRATIGNCAISENIVCTNQGFQNLICKEDYDTKFIMYSIRYNLRRLMQYAQGTTFLEISKTNLAKIKIPCPKDPKEGKEIGIILSNVDKVIQDQNQIIENTIELKRGLLKKLFTYGVSGNESEKIQLKPRFFKMNIPKNWKCMELGELLSILKDGTHNPPMKVTEGIPLLTAENIHDGIVDYEKDYWCVSEKDYQDMHKTYEIQEDDILLTIVGSLGRVSKVKKQKKFSVQRSVAVFRTNGEISSNYLYYFIQTKYFQDQLISRAKSTAQSGIYLGELSKISIWYPEEKLDKNSQQEKIAQILSNIDQLIENEKEYKSKIEKIKNGIMQQLLTGQKRVKI